MIRGSRTRRTRYTRGTHLRLWLVCFYTVKLISGKVLNLTCEEILSSCEGVAAHRGPSHNLHRENQPWPGFGQLGRNP